MLLHSKTKGTRINQEAHSLSTINCDTLSQFFRCTETNSDDQKNQNFKKCTFLLVGGAGAGLLRG